MHHTRKMERLFVSLYVSVLVHVCVCVCLFVWWTIIGMRRSQRGCTAVSENQMAEQSVMRQTTETQPDPEDLKGRRRREGGELKG